jgi:hypothetical protein
LLPYDPLLLQFHFFATVCTLVLVEGAGRDADGEAVASLLGGGSGAALPGRCTKCGRMVEYGGSVCTRCTARRGGQTVFVVVVLAGGFMMTRHFYTPPGHRQNGDVIAAPFGGGGVVRDPAAAHTAVPKPGVAGWVYFDVDDPLVHDTAHHARLLGDKPGADGPSGPGTLELTSSAHYGKRAIISFPKVKAACDANPCTLRLTFQRIEMVQPPAPPVVVPSGSRRSAAARAAAAAAAAQPPPAPVPTLVEASDAYAFHDISDDDSTILQLDDFDPFLQQLNGAKKMIVAAQFGMTHDYALAFTVDGFSAGRMREGK